MKDAILKIFEKYAEPEDHHPIYDPVRRRNWEEVANEILALKHEIAKQLWDEYWEAEGQHWGNPEVVRDFPSWLDNNKPE